MFIRPLSNISFSILLVLDLHRYSDLDSQGLGLHGFGLLQSCIRIHFRTAPQVHIPGTAPLTPGGHPIIVSPAALLAALDLLHGPDGEVLQPGPVLEGLSLRPEPVRFLLQLPGFMAGLGQDADSLHGRPGLLGQLQGLFSQGLSLLSGRGLVHAKIVLWHCIYNL